MCDETQSFVYRINSFTTAGQPTWHTAVLPPKFHPIWAACSRTFVNSICGSCSLKEGARSISAILAVGGEQILKPSPKKKSILWEQTKMRLYLASLPLCEKRIYQGLYRQSSRDGQSYARNLRRYFLKTGEGFAFFIRQNMQKGLKYIHYGGKL